MQWTLSALLAVLHEANWSCAQHATRLLGVQLLLSPIHMLDILDSVG